MTSAHEERQARTSKPWLPKKWDHEADVVVVGYGGAGVCAAIAAHDAGVQALILEKAPFGGGNTGCCGGGMRIPRDVSDAIEFYTCLTQGTVDAESIRALAQAMVELPDRLEEWGAELEYFPRAMDFPTLPGSRSFHEVASIVRTAQEKEKQARAGGTVYPAHGKELFEFLANQAGKRNIRVMYNTPATKLIQDPLAREILGVKAQRVGEEAEISIKAGRAVVLACGGFQNNKEMLVNFLPYLTQLPVYPYGTPHNTGDGIEMAAEAGAKLWHMSGCELAAFAPKAPSERFGVGFRMERQLPTGSQAIYVNKYGKRFMNESIRLNHRKDLFKVQCFDHDRAEYPNIPFYMVFDETFRKKRPIIGTHIGWGPVHGLYEWSDDNSAEIEQGWIVRANTVRELGEKMKIDSRVLEETIGRYNRCCTTGEDPDFGRAKEWLVPLATPPYYATELCEPIINTNGGPKRNAWSQVLNKNDKPIPRLYAAGELGSFFFPLYEGASNLPEALAFGRIAGEHAAALTPWE